MQVKGKVDRISSTYIKIRDFTKGTGGGPNYWSMAKAERKKVTGNSDGGDLNEEVRSSSGLLVVTH